MSDKLRDLKKQLLSKETQSLASIDLEKVTKAFLRLWDSSEPHMGKTCNSDELSQE